MLGSVIFLQDLREEVSMKTIFTNGVFYSMDNKNTVYSTLVTRNGKITDVYKHNISSLEESETQLVDLHGATVLPGFIDTHLHLLDYALFEKRLVSLSGVRSVEQLIKKVQAFIDEIKPHEGDWVEGFGWDQEAFEDGNFPTAKQLDLISKKHPIMLIRRCSTICVANSLAMELSGIDRDTPDPTGGKIVRDNEGHPTGLMLESAMSLVGNTIPKIKDKALIKELLLFSIGELLKNGITVAHTEDFTSVADKKVLWDAYTELQAERKLPIYLVLQMRIRTPEQIEEAKSFGLTSWQSDRRIKMGPLKLLGDGTLGGWSAALKKPYSDRPNTKGLLYYSEEEMTALCRKAIDNDFDLTIHAIGDAAVEMFLDSCLTLKGDVEEKKLRPSIIHSQIMSEEIFEKYLQLPGSNAIIQPMYIHSDWEMAQDRVGERIATSYCYKKIYDMGIHISAGSDLPIESVNPFHAIQVMVTRQDLSGQPVGGWLPEERMSILEALKLHTINGAFVSKDEDRFGTLEPGKTANFVIVSEDPFLTPNHRLKEIRIEKTYVDGQCVFERIK